jgi:2-polyprenyl-6-methoxyphenol hydroxylase-like FAD-dependent oxidoreductase
MARTLDIPVLIVGAGPVGLTLAMDLAWRGVDVLVVEMRRPGEPPSVKCNHVSARSMEIFRRLGIAEAVRDAGLPADYPNDCAYRTTATGIELSRIPIPSRKDRFIVTDGPDGWWPTPEPPHRINQIYLEPLLFQHTALLPNVRVLNRTCLEDFEQDANGITATVCDLDSGDLRLIRCEYLVGCDGGRSRVRHKIGASFEGTPVVQRVQSTCLRAPELLERLHGKKAWMYLSLNPRRRGTLIAIDGREIWLIHNHLEDVETEFDSVDRDWSIRTILGVGPEFKYEVLSKEDWVGRRLVADKFRDRRAFICGDAAHLWIPYAGYGMNAGIADAANLAWLLAARFDRWAPEDILDAYEIERQPITEQVSNFAMSFALEVMKHRKSVPAEIEAPGEEGDALRTQIGREAYDLNVRQYCCGGLNFGYFYEGSPLIAYDGALPPGYTMYDFTPSTVPGCRTPHIWLADGRSLYDAMGPGYTLLRFDPRVPVSAFEQAAADRNVPFHVLDVRSAEAAVYDRKLVLSRPDQHIAWRGDSPPGDPEAIVDLVRGAVSKSARYAA